MVWSACCCLRRRVRRSAARRTFLAMGGGAAASGRLWRGGGSGARPRRRLDERGARASVVPRGKTGSSAEWKVQKEMGIFSARSVLMARKPATRSSQNPAAAQFSTANDAAMAVESFSLA